MLNKNMMYIERMVSYVEKTFGSKMSVRDWKEQNNLPLILREQYVFLIIRLFDSDHLVFIETGETGNTPAVIAKHCRMLTDYWDKGIVYSRGTLSSTDRARLIQAKIPFIIPHRQLYLPFIGIDMKELFPSGKKMTDTLSPSAQLLVLGKLYEKNWITESPTGMSEMIGISKMSIGRAFCELEQHGIASVRISGKQKTLEFGSHGKGLWEQALPLLKSPVTSSKTVPYAERKDLILSGPSALSRYTMLQEPETMTYAVFNRKKACSNQMERQNGIDDRDMIIQKWSYDPLLLSSEGIVDPLSVYLEFQESDDERVEIILEDLIGEMRW